jgi:hypothetical protein
LPYDSPTPGDESSRYWILIFQDIRTVALLNM